MKEERKRTEEKKKKEFKSGLSNSKTSAVKSHMVVTVIPTEKQSSASSVMLKS